MPHPRHTPSALLYCIIGCVFSVLAFAAGSAAGPDKTLEVRLKAERTLFALGEPVVVQVSISNKGVGKQFLVRAQEGSEAGVRYPHVLTRLSLEGTVLATRRQPADKVYAPLAPEAFFMLLPGAERALYPDGLDLGSVYSFDKPGTYRLEISYSTVCEKEWEWYGPYNEETWEARYDEEYWRQLIPQERRNRACLEKLSRLELKSAPLVFEVVDHLLTKDEAMLAAKKAFEEAGWSCVDPVATDGGVTWDIQAPCAQLGGNSFVRIDKRNGCVLEKRKLGP